MRSTAALLVALAAAISPSRARATEPPPRITSSAIRTRASISLDGKDDEAAWKEATVIDAFRMFDPTEDGEARLRTVVRIMYDNRNLYVHVRAFDPHPDSIAGLLSRRDVRTQSDYINVMIDSYHDKRTGYAFAVNPAGVQRDTYMYNDGVEDLSWDGVWDVKTVIDSLGWTAEYRIPLGQLRFAAAPEHTFGVMVIREVQRYGERYSWPLLRRSRVGLVSQFGDVNGFRSLPTPRRVEMRPYVVARNLPSPGKTGDRAQEQSAGLDLKLGVGSNLTVDATVNPDFGQVEADPAVLNLTAFEQAFSERRPFFLEGAGIFRFDVDCNDGACTGLFYPRRIGRTPQLRASFGDVATPITTTILGAAKLTGRLPSGLSVGFLDAVTQREEGALGRTVEPQTNYAVGRLQQEFNGGQSVLGGMVTMVNRQLEASTDPFLRGDAYVAGIDGRKRFLQQRYEVSGYLSASRVAGTAEAIKRTQLSSVQQFQRPDDDLALDSSRTSLGGWSGSLSLSKNGGGQTRFNTNYRIITPGFEINDIGFLRRADLQSWSNWYGIQKLKPTKYYRRFNLNFNQWNSWSNEGLPLSRGGNVNANSQLANFWGAYSGIGFDNQLGSIYDDRLTRGGPAVRRNPSMFGWAGFDLDPRKPVIPGLGADVSRRYDGRGWNVNIGPRVSFRGSSRVQGSLSAGYSRGVTPDQFINNYGVIGSDTTHYTVARLDQTTTSLTARLDVTASPTLSLQVYAQPYISNGLYHNWNELKDPSAARFEDRWQPYRDTPPGGFTYKQFNSNVVLRWEYRPGSTIFAVWQQGRLQDGAYPGSYDARRDFNTLFSTVPSNVFLIKASYWLGR